MKSAGRFCDPLFLADETLFRRVPTRLWDTADKPPIEAIDLPDISVGRSKYGHPEWVRHDAVNGKHFDKWGVIGIVVSAIPNPFANNGVALEFSCVHDPLENDYPHTEIRMFDGGEHLDRLDGISEEMHLLWRESALREVRILLRPRQKCRDREECPLSHIVAEIPQV